jgi:hypothetical protein
MRSDLSPEHSATFGLRPAASGRVSTAMPAQSTDTMRTPFVNVTLPALTDF